MNVQQKISLLVFPKWNKATNGEAPVYIRITIDGLREEVGLGFKITSHDWESDAKKVLSSHPKCIAFNKKIDKAIVDLGRHFDLVQAKHEIATPLLVKQSYKGIKKEQPVKNQPLINLAYNERVDTVVNKYLQFCKKEEKLNGLKDGPTAEMQLLLNAEKERVRNEIDSLVKDFTKTFYQPNHTKTLIMAVNDYFISFIQLAFVGERAYTSLEKNMCRKRRFIEFFRWKFQKSDIPLRELKYELLEEFKNYCMLHHGVGDVSITKLIQFFKEMVSRVVPKGWITVNVFDSYQCRYKEKEPEWPEYDQVIDLYKQQFDEPVHNETRDISVFQAFTGLGYNELFYLRSEDIVVINQKKWISKNRRKSGNNEPVPLLPITLEIMEKYKDHPKCQRSGRLLPVPSNQEYNRRLKKIAKKLPADFGGKKTTHVWRYFFANEVTYDNGVDLKIISRMLAHKSIRTTERYVRPNKKSIGRSMQMVEEKLFTAEGSLRGGVTKEPDSIPEKIETSAEARIIPMPARR